MFAQEASLEATVSKNKLGLNQRLRIEFSVNKQGGDNFTPPSFANFKIVGGPSQSVSQSWINGKASFSQSYTYVIQPTRKGELTIGAASVEFGGKTVKSEPIKIIVLDAVDIPKDPNDPTYIAQQNIHLVAEISKSRPYVGEGVYVEYRLYVSENVSVYNYGVTEAPKYNGFWNQEIKINGQLSVKRGKYNGENYRYITLQKALLIPTKSGRLEIDPMKMDIVIGVPSGRADFFGNVITRNVTKEFSSAKKIIRAKTLPLEGKPANFIGAVGDFNFDGKVDFDPSEEQEILELDTLEFSWFLHKMSENDQTSTVNELKKENYSIFPNPSSGKFHLVFKECLKSVDIRVTNIQGVEVFKSHAEYATYMALDFDASPGIYFLNIKTKDNEQVVKLVKK